MNETQDKDVIPDSINEGALTVDREWRICRRGDYGVPRKETTGRRKTKVYPHILRGSSMFGPSMMTTSNGPRDLFDKAGVVALKNAKRARNKKGPNNRMVALVETVLYNLNRLSCTTPSPFTVFPLQNGPGNV